MPDQADLQADVGITLNKLIRQLAQAEARMNATAKKFESDFDKANKNVVRGFKRTSAAAGQMGSSISRLSGQQRFLITNTSNQIGDLAVQLSSGTSAARAFGQQLPQLLGALGPLGAILGTVAAIGIPVGAALFSMAGSSEDAATSAKTLAKEVDELETAVSEYITASDAAAASTSDLRAKYGEAATEARQLLKVNKELARANALAELGEAVDAISGRFGQFTTEQIDRLSQIDQRLQELRTDGIDPGGNLLDQRIEFTNLTDQRNALGGVITVVAELEQRFSVTRVEALELARALADLRNAQGPEQVAAALERMRSKFVQIVGSISEMTAEQREFLQEAIGTEKQAALLNATLANTPGALNAAAASAANLANEIGRAADNAAALVSSGLSALQQSEIDLQFKGDPVGRAAARAAAAFDRKSGFGSSSLPDGLTEQLKKQRQAFIDAATATEQNRQELIAWTKAQAEAQKTANGRRRGGSRRRRSSGGGGSATRANGFDNAVQRIQQRTAAIQAETAAMQTLNPLVDDYGFAVAKTRIEQELLQQAQQAGLAITPELKAQIEQLAQAYAQAEAGAKQLADGQQKAQEIASFAKGEIGTFIRDLRDGASLADAASAAFGRLGDKFLDLALDAAFSTNALGAFFGALGSFGSGGSGGFNLLGFLGLKGGGKVPGLANGGQVVTAASGGFVSGPGGPRDDRVPALLSDGEYVVNARATKANLPLLEAINAGQLAKLADGGLISNVNATLAAANQSIGAARQPQINVAAPNVIVQPPEVAVLDNEERFYDRLSSARGEAIIVDIGQKNSS